MTSQAPDQSSIVSVTKLAAIVGKSRWWARDKLNEWLEEQQKGGPQRVFFQKGKRRLLYTTIAVVQREFVGVHDPVMKRKIRDLEQTIEFLVKRVDRLTDDVAELRRRRTP
jgi:hypothetical protein